MLHLKDNVKYGIRELWKTTTHSLDRDFWTFSEISINFFLLLLIV